MKTHARVQPCTQVLLTPTQVTALTVLGVFPAERIGVVGTSADVTAALAACPATHADGDVSSVLVDAADASDATARAAVDNFKQVAKDTGNPHLSVMLNMPTFDEVRWCIYKYIYIYIWVGMVMGGCACVCVCVCVGRYVGVSVCMMKWCCRWLLVFHAKRS